ncbi:hypothetical protein [Sulfurimonas sp.]
MSVDLLKKACDKHSQRKTGVMIGKSAATVNLILKGTYPKPEKILQKVSEVFADLNSTEFNCPVLGEIHVDVCKKYKSMAEQNKVHKDRLYMQVKSECVNCKRKGDG